VPDVCVLLFVFLVILFVIRAVCSNILYYMYRQLMLFLILVLVISDEVYFTGNFMSFNHMPGDAYGEAGLTLTREELLSMRQSALQPDQCTRQYILSLGCAGRRSYRAGHAKTKDKHCTLIPIVVGHRHTHAPVRSTPTTRQRTLVNDRKSV